MRDGINCLRFCTAFPVDRTTRPLTRNSGIGGANPAKNFPGPSCPSRKYFCDPLPPQEKYLLSPTPLAKFFYATPSRRQPVLPELLVRRGRHSEKNLPAPPHPSRKYFCDPPVPLSKIVWTRRADRPDRSGSPKCQMLPGGKSGAATGPLLPGPQPKPRPDPTFPPVIGLKRHIFGRRITGILPIRAQNSLP